PPTGLLKYFQRAGLRKERATSTEKSWNESFCHRLPLSAELIRLDRTWRILEPPRYFERFPTKCLGAVLHFLPGAGTGRGHERHGKIVFAGAKVLLHFALTGIRQLVLRSPVLQNFRRGGMVQPAINLATAANAAALNI